MTATARAERYRRAAENVFTSGAPDTQADVA